ncbi:hypothetical protein DSECCO2_487440 [anaerobic digester metagenome]
MIQDVVVELDGLEDRPVGLERYPGSLEAGGVEGLPRPGAVALLVPGPHLVLGLRAARERLCYLALPELHRVDVAIPKYRCIEPACEGVDDRDADAVQASGDLVGVLVELSAGVKDGEDDLKCALAVLGHHIDGDATPVILDRDRAVTVDDDPYQVAEPGKGLVYGVIHNLVDQVV